QLAADALEQLGYAAESATWRNAYLLGALELRKGVGASTGRIPLNPDVLRAMSVEQLFDLLGVRLNGDRAEGKHLVINWVLPDGSFGGARALPPPPPRAGPRREGAAAPAPPPRPPLNRLVLRELPIAEAVQSGQIRIDGDPAKLAELFDLFDDFSLMFEIV